VLGRLNRCHDSGFGHAILVSIFFDDVGSIDDTLV
jgi:hypothetical protein